MSLILNLLTIFLLFAVSDVSCLNDNFKYLQIPLFETCDFGENTRLNRNWMEGYYTQEGAYIRLYMSIFDTKGYPQYKDIWQDKSGHIVIHPAGRILWIGFGRPDRQIFFAKKYITDGLKAGGKNEPLIRSFLVKADVITDISKWSSIERYASRGLDLNVDTTKSSNQFGLEGVSTEWLRQNALVNSMVTYYLKSRKDVRSWGKTENVKVLEERVALYNMDREIPKDCEWTFQELFPISQDFVFQDNAVNLQNAIAETAIYKQLLIKRKVLLDLIEAIQAFFQIGGIPYRELSVRFERNVVKSTRLTEKFRLGEELTKGDLDHIENAMTSALTKNGPSNKADMALWDRFRLSVDQVRDFVKFAGNEIRIGNQNRLIQELNIFQDYKVFPMPNQDPLPRMLLIQDSGNVGIRMDYYGENAIEICRVIKHNCIGNRIRNLQIISPLYDVIEIFTYAKHLSDCLEQNGNLYTERAIQATLVTIYGTDLNEYRFYPDAQVAWSEYDSGTVLLFENGAVVNLCIKGYPFAWRQVLDATLETTMPELYRSIVNMERKQADGLVIVPQHKVKWVKPGRQDQRCWG